MTILSRILIQLSAALFLGFALASSAFAGSGDAMSRDIEFKESLGRQVNQREATDPQPSVGFVAKRAGRPKTDRTPK
jgi:hypothetical protein